MTADAYLQEMAFFSRSDLIKSGQVRGSFVVFGGVKTGYRLAFAFLSAVPEFSPPEAFISEERRKLQPEAAPR